MSITASTVLWDQRQLDGRRYVRERHTDHLGVPHDVDYLAEAGQNVTAGLPASAVRVAVQLAEGDVSRVIGEAQALGHLATPTVQHATLAQVQAGLREAFRATTGEPAAGLGAWLNTLTNTRLQALFGLDAAQVLLLRTRLGELRTTWDRIRVAQGE
mgnify:CR=1 FL=1